MSIGKILISKTSFLCYIESIEVTGMNKSDLNTQEKLITGFVDET
jgi:hypothetical protein